MKPNGRRRWRKRAAGQRYKQRKLGCDWDFWKQNRHYALACRHMAKRMGDPPLPSAPAKPFSARSLVGMSNSARKWLARIDLVVAMNGPGMQPATRDESRTLLHRWSIDLNLQGAQEVYVKARAKYRIGQRLRPCPGCAKCRAEICLEGPSCRWCREHSNCDGSGVLPARKAAK